jgi:hypothetical protein
MANENIGQIGLDVTDIRCEECNHIFYSQDEYCPHLRLKQSADDQVLISSLLALAGEPPAPYAVSMIYKKQFVKLSIDHRSGKLSSRKIMKIFKTFFFF